MNLQNQVEETLKKIKEIQTQIEHLDKDIQKEQQLKS